MLLLFTAINCFVKCIGLQWGLGLCKSNGLDISIFDRLHLVFKSANLRCLFGIFHSLLFSNWFRFFPIRLLAQYLFAPTATKLSVVVTRMILPWLYLVKEIKERHLRIRGKMDYFVFCVVLDKNTYVQIAEHR